MPRATAATGVVLDVTGDTVTVDLEEGGSETLQKMRHVSCSVGDLAHVTTVGQARFVDGVIGSSTAPVADAALVTVPPAPQDLTSGAWPFGPTASGTYGPGGWSAETTLLRQGVLGSGTPRAGAAWYGEGPSSLPGTLAAGQLLLVRVEGDTGPVVPTIALYAGLEQPAGEPTVLATALGPALLLDVPTTWPLPDAWLSSIDSGTAAGLGCWTPNPAPVLALSTEGGGMSLTCWWEET